MSHYRSWAYEQFLLLIDVNSSTITKPVKNLEKQGTAVESIYKYWEHGVEIFSIQAETYCHMYHLCAVLSSGIIWLIW